MTNKEPVLHTCAICNKSFGNRHIVSGEIIRKEIAAEILKEYPEWSAEKFICRTDLAKFRGRYVHTLLESEKGELSSLEQEVVRSMQEHEVLSSNVDTEFEKNGLLANDLPTKSRISAAAGHFSFYSAYFSSPGLR